MKYELHRDLTDGEVAEMSARRAMGDSIQKIARDFGTTRHRAFKAVDPVGYKIYRRKREAQGRWAAQSRRDAGLTSFQKMTVARVETKARELLRLIPDDTRDLTAKLLGDPLVGRRAIDMKKSPGIYPQM